MITYNQAFVPVQKFPKQKAYDKIKSTLKFQYICIISILKFHLFKYTILSHLFSKIKLVSNKSPNVKKPIKIDIRRYNFCVV